MGSAVAYFGSHMKSHTRKVYPPKSPTVPLEFEDKPLPDLVYDDVLRHQRTVVVGNSLALLNNRLFFPYTDQLQPKTKATPARLRWMTKANVLSPMNTT